MLGSDRILALDIGNSKLVLAEFKITSSKNLELVKYTISPLGFDPETTTDSAAYIVSGIRDAMRSSGIRPGPVAVSMSGQMVFPRYVKLPPVTPDKIAQIVRYEAQQNVPFPIDEVARQEWLAVFNRILDDAPAAYGFPSQHLEGLRVFLREFSGWMVNKA